VISRRRLAHHGQPAKDAAVSVRGEPAQIRVMVFGSSAYIFEGFGVTTARFAHDYQILLETFTPNRCVWGSDWPFLRMPMRMDYGPVLTNLERWIADPSDRRQVLWDTPARLFGFT